VAPISFVIDGDDVVFNTGADTGKGRALARRGMASFVVDDQMPPFSFVKIDGSITLHDDLDEVRRLATIIGGRYMGPDRAEEYGERSGRTLTQQLTVGPSVSERVRCGTATGRRGRGPRRTDPVDR